MEALCAAGWGSSASRALLSVDAGRVVLRSRRGTDMLPAFPEIDTRAVPLPDATALDGVM
ncbi:hypothetical protein GCM10010256_74100 [Streptomyces coeruleorubidus]|uniref:Uncharacterized protein n=1 Tax=Streptomyces coeruleorubidus TaxID=116188 RepID=A0A5J6I0X7_STRC4|nr:hypothetical protein CP976_00375 [Streptomyces coeruleorubidus]GGU03186.1 hypothetical protein GCM10010256_74100 [Streptomyces coeruleorubidus]